MVTLGVFVLILAGALAFAIVLAGMNLPDPKD